MKPNCHSRESGNPDPAGQLLTHFERITDAPDASPRLRRFILDLAVRGKLVPQDPNDEPASELLKRIAKEKTRLVKAGKVRKQKPIAPTEQAEQPLTPPRGWSVTRLGWIAECLDYMRKPVNGDERKRRIAGKSQSELFPYFGATQQQGWIDDYIFDEELVLLGEDGVPFFEPLREKAYLIAGKSWVNNHAHVFRATLVSSQFLVHYLNVFDYSGRVVGATRSKLNQAKAIDIPIMLPPLAEQHRIVAKVDELMTLCDRFEAARMEREATCDRMTTASLSRLNAPDPEPATFQNHAAFALNNLTPLTTRPDQIKVLRQTILNLAVRGKLVPQDPNDELASELLKRIEKEKKSLIRSGKIMGSKPSSPVIIEDFDLRAGWVFARFREILVELQTGPFGSTLHQSDYEKGGTPVVNPASIQKERIVSIEKMAVGAATIKRLATFRLRQGDIVMGRRGEMGRCAEVTQRENGWLCGTGSLILRLPKCLYPRFFVMLLGSPYAREYLSRSSVGATMQNLNQSILLNLVIGLPPLAEQHRIVAKVDELMALCDRLEASLATSDDTRCHLLDALLHEALAPH